MLEQSTVWIVTDEAIEETIVSDGQRGGVDRGGGFGAVGERVATVVRQRVPIPVETLKQQMMGLLQVVTQVFDQAEAHQRPGMELDEVELTVEVNGEGQVSLLGSGGKMGGKGGITLKFKRKPLPSTPTQQLHSPL